MNGGNVKLSVWQSINQFLRSISYWCIFISGCALCYLFEWGFFTLLFWSQNVMHWLVARSLPLTLVLELFACLIAQQVGMLWLQCLRLVHYIWKFSTFLSFFSPFFSTVIFFFNKEPNFIDINEIIKAIVFVERWRCHVRRFGRLLGLMPPCRHYELGSILLDWSPFL